jgi:hypothetical protein
MSCPFHWSNAADRARLLAPLLLAAAALGGLGGCGPSFAIETPAGFVELEQEYSSYDYRATSADGLVLAVREIDHDPKGELSFWVKAIENRMRERGGYALLESAPTKSADGVAGMQLRFGLDVDSSPEGGGVGKPHLYYVAVFVTDARIFVIEAGGTKELMTAQAQAIEAALRSFKTKG